MPENEKPTSKSGGAQSCASLDRWHLNQNLKPDDTLGYDWTPAQGFIASLPVRNLEFPADRFEIFSFCAEARCFALGAQAGVGGQFVGNQVDLDTKFAFGPQPKGHSTQFRSTITARGAFWSQLLIDLQLLQ